MLRWTEEQLKSYKALQRDIALAMHDDKPPAKSKYRNKKTEIDGRKFDSMAEGARYVELMRLQDAGLIFDLKCQEAFKLPVNGFLVCNYKADFVYVDTDGNRVVEDVKGGPVTPVYALKKKLMRAIHGIEIKEVRKAPRRCKIKN